MRPAHRYLTLICLAVTVLWMAGCGSSGSAEFYFNRAKEFDKTKDWDHAIADLKTALALATDPDLHRRAEEQLKDLTP